MESLVVIGQGYVGLPLAQGATHSGLKVTGLDTNPQTVHNLNLGISHVDDISDAELKIMLDAGYSATTDPDTIATADAVVICVPTPLGEAGSPDLGAVEGAVRTVAKHITPGTLVVLESTTYPGTTDDFVRPMLEESGLDLDTQFHLAFSPERIDPGNAHYGLTNTPKVVGGVSEASTLRASEFYSKFVETVVPTRGAKEAETAKLLENTYRHINIALVNEMAKFCHDLDIDLWDVIDAARTKPFGFQAFYPGPGVGGHCIPIDPNYLSYQVRKALGYPFRFVELAEEINNSMPQYVVRRVQDLLNQNAKPLMNAHVLLLGITYKADIADQRESPATPIAELFQGSGTKVSFHDPRVKSWHVNGEELQSQEDLAHAVAQADVTILLQMHSEYDTEHLAAVSNLFFDTRGVTKGRDAHRL
ncbi:nucleotide sugar dehydrogenase [Arthrobacter tumbae]|uniref:nucleotide sugar dehydrogenase n=1 Tax=Arthrobacter tumbae TaxID=163874 RepID=UPI001958AFB5|nr:nucleotide sugar dehydrogenase [Arthrobacter tumbae]MBM7782545.1 nucleotide sugar dehydrogenase [Arthrobacter tumbae]